MPLQIYNSFTKIKEEFKPLNPPYVGMYVCGPTVYAHSHLGHARSYIVSDMIYRYLLYKEYKVRYVQNITDVGHLIGNMDEGEDKIQKQALLEKQQPVEIAYKYEVSYFEDMDALNILRPNISCRATGHIPDMIKLIETLIKKKHAYVTDKGNIYFDVRSFPSYGKLTNRTLDEAKEGERIEIASDKINPEDFALWKRADDNHIMQWDSPWGKGYPGWHIECSVMATKYIGDTLDIHEGGIENSFPHHDCEIAQSEAATGKPFVKYFMHHNMLTVNGTKMGKSLGNFIILKDFFKKYDPMVLRFYILQGHYRSPLDFTDDALQAAKHGYERLMNSILTLQSKVESKNTIEESKAEEIEDLKNEFLDNMDDDFNTSKSIAVLYEILKVSNNELIKPKSSISKLKYIQKTVNDLACKILGFKFDKENNKNNIEENLIQTLIDLRNNARKDKNFKLSDEIRDKLNSIGIILKDGNDGTTYISASIK